MNGWSMIQQSGISYMQLDVFAQTDLVVHGFSARMGGVSQDNYRSLNLGLHVGDDCKKVLENRRKFASALGVSFRDMIIPAQVHGDQIALVRRQQAGSGACDLLSVISGADALVTDEPGLPLCTLHADCVPIFILDPVRKVIGLAHAGWKGTILKIGAKTLQYMQRVFKTKPEDCMVGIGPSIGPCCYEVDFPVLQQIVAAFSSAKLHLLVNKSNEQVKNVQRKQKEKDISDKVLMSDRVYFNLWEANRLSLIESGVQPEKIWIACICTKCHQDKFFSYRGVNGQATGRMGAVISLGLTRPLV